MGRIKSEKDIRSFTSDSVYFFRSVSSMFRIYNRSVMGEELIKCNVYQLHYNHSMIKLYFHRNLILRICFLNSVECPPALPVILMGVRDWVSRHEPTIDTNHQAYMYLLLLKVVRFNINELLLVFFYAFYLLYLPALVDVYFITKHGV